jgi:hypothetical protein
MGNQICLLSGKLVIDAPRPRGLESDLNPFFMNPNDAKWGRTICRPLYHEILHFWQFLGYRYVASLVAQEWERLLAFEATGHVVPLSHEQRDFEAFRADGGFSAFELLECWTRYWDVHTRSPSTIIEDEGLASRIDFRSHGWRRLGDFISYTGDAFDYVMTHGPLSGLYERPYAWTLQAFGEDSYTSALLFPMACYGAFLSAQPVAIFERTIADAASLFRQDKLFSAPLTRFINADWAIHTKDVLGRLLPPVYGDAGLTPATGISIIGQSSLAEHPVYGNYLEREMIFRGGIRKAFQEFRDGINGSEEQRYLALSAIFANEDNSHVFLCPGEPIFRDILGTAFPPVRVAFEDGNVDVGHTPMRKLRALNDPTIELDDYSTRIDNLCKRVAAFHDAEVIARLSGG